MSNTDEHGPDIRHVARCLGRALAALADASYEPPAARIVIVTLAAAQEFCRQADAAIEQLRLDSEQGQKLGPENDDSDGVR